MEQVTFIQYYFHNPILCFIFCISVLNTILWIEKKYEWVDYLIGSTVVTGLFILFSFLGMGTDYSENKDSIAIHPINSMVSNIIMIVSLLFIITYVSIKVFAHYKKKGNENKAIAIVVENLKSDVLTMQAYVFKLETSQPYSNKETLELQFEMNDVIAMIEGIEFQRDKQNEIKRIKNKISEIRRKL